MIGVLVKLNIKEGSEKDFEENMLKLVEATNSNEEGVFYYGLLKTCLLYTSPSPRDDR